MLTASLGLTQSTNNGPLEVDIATAPTDSHITFLGTTSNSRATLSLPPAFEGNIKGVTSGYMKAGFEYDDRNDDPSGQGRKRSIATTILGRGIVKVKTWWGNEEINADRGQADVVTSNAPVSITVS